MEFGFHHLQLWFCARSNGMLQASSMVLNSDWMTNRNASLWLDEVNNDDDLDW